MDQTTHDAASTPDPGDPGDPESVVRAFLRHLEDGEAEAAVALLHEEVEWRNSGLPTFRRARVGRLLRDMVRRHVGFEAHLHHIAASRGTVLTDRTDVIRLGRVATTFAVRGTFEVVDGRIRVWDDAFGWGAAARGTVLGLVRAAVPGRR